MQQSAAGGGGGEAPPSSPEELLRMAQHWDLANLTELSAQLSRYIHDYGLSRAFATAAAGGGGTVEAADVRKMEALLASRAAQQQMAGCR